MNHIRSGRLKDFAFINKNTLPANTNPEQLINYIEISNVDNNGVINIDAIEELRFETAPSRARRIIYPQDTIISSVRPNLQAMAFFASAEENLICSTGFNVVSPRFSHLDGQYLFYLLRSNDSFQYFVSSAKGVGYPAIDDKDFGTLQLSFPPVEEQRRIAAFLDQQCAAIDGAIAVKQQQLEKFDTLGKTVLSKAVLEGLDDNAPKRNPHSLWFSEIPAHWDIRRLKDVSTMQTGITLGKDYDEPTEERPYLRVANVQDGHLALDDMKTINLPPALIPRYQLQPGDVLMTEGGDLDKLGRGYVWNNELPGCLHQNHVFALRCQPHKLLPDYLAMLTSSTHGRAYFEITGKKTTNLASTNATKVNLFPIPLPPVAEQARIVAWVKAELDKIQQARAVVSRQVEVLAEYKKSLIHECVTGKRRVVV